MTLDEFLELLDGVRPAGNGYVAQCPAHEDNEASLGITESDEGLLLNCYAGCETSDVLAELDLTFSDLFFNSRSTTKGQEPEITYSYTDEVGVELFQALRFPGKKFKQRHHDPDDDKADSEGWVWNLQDVRRVLYRLPEVIAGVARGETVYLVEGEKDVETLRALGKVATTSPMGSGQWRPEFTRYFTGAKVVIVADRDEPGRKYAEIAKAAIEQVTASVWVVEARTGKDVTDHLAAGHSLEELKWIRKQRRGIVSTSELAQHALERLEMTETDLPGYVLCGEIPLVFRPGRMYAIGAYTGEGKTCLALQGFRELSAAGRKVGYHSLEMPEIDLMNRLLAHRGIPLSYTENPWMLKERPDLMATYDQAVAEIGGWQSDIVFDSAASAESIRERTLDREHEVVIVDHLHRFSFSDRQKLDAQVKGLTNIALELNVMVIVLCQLRKTQRGNGLDVYPRPTLQDFRETSQIGDDASMALAVWRQRDKAGLQYTGLNEVLVLKNRHTTGAQDGSGKSFYPRFDLQRQMFVPAPAVIPMTGGFS